MSANQTRQSKLCEQISGVKNSNARILKACFISRDDGVQILQRCAGDLQVVFKIVAGQRFRVLQRVARDITNFKCFKTSPNGLPRTCDACSFSGNVENVRIR
jgi:hypothetical protein